MSLRARLLLGAALGLGSAIVVLAAANATWRIVTPERVVVDTGGTPVVLSDPRPLKGSTQDASLPLFAVVGAAAAIVAPMLSAKPRIGASAFLAASGSMIAAAAAITRSVRSVPDAWRAAEGGAFTFGPPTAAPLIAVAGGAGMVAAGVWLLTAARRAPRLSMPEGPPEGGDARDARDEGAWE